jgi:type 1 glutamine amidotransferase
MIVQFKEIQIKETKKPETSQNSDDSGKKKVVLIAGRKSHGYGAHEHKAGCMLLADALNKSGLPIEAQVVTDGWPDDASVLDGADSIVIYSDGGGGHPFNAHIDELNKLTAAGTGIVCIHYGVEVPEGKSGNAFLDWTGGYFEANWSVNPHWVAEYDQLPMHPITKGVKPFSINDEWYYHMRFREQMEGVTPILTDLPPKSTLSRPDGAHSGNPFVREAFANGVPQHMAWARERPDGGRGFGISGGHFHWNWGHNQMRKVVLNAIAWSAGVDVPSDGVSSKTLSVKDLMANQDEDVPGDFNPERIAAMLAEWNAE